MARGRSRLTDPFSEAISTRSLNQRRVVTMEGGHLTWERSIVSSHYDRDRDDCPHNRDRDDWPSPLFTSLIE